MNLTVKTPQKLCILVAKKQKQCFFVSGFLKGNAFRHKAMTGEDDYFVEACKLLAKFK